MLTVVHKLTAPIQKQNEEGNKSKKIPATVPPACVDLNLVKELMSTTLQGGVSYCFPSSRRWEGAKASTGILRTPSR